MTLGGWLSWTLEPIEVALTVEELEADLVDPTPAGERELEPAGL